MTVNYTAEVATCGIFGCFGKLLFRWRGSIYKMVWMEIVVFLSLYYFFHYMYRYVLNPAQKRIFENIVSYCDNNSVIPLSFVLGFYVSIVMTRWWNQYLAIPWPDDTATFVSTLLHGRDERGRIMRRTIMRYVCLALTMTFARISPSIKRRFPNWDYFVNAGLLVEKEKNILLKFDRLTPLPKHFLPIIWAASIVTRARKEGRIRDDHSVQTIVTELASFGKGCGRILKYMNISIPLIYTQVVTLAVYSYFAFNVMGSQWVDIRNIDGFYNWVDCYFPIFQTLEFFFYMGWLKVAEILINPYGEDDDDFEVNWIIDRNIRISYLIVDAMHHEHPELARDQHWDIFPTFLPYANANYKREFGPEPSTAKIGMPRSGMFASTSTPNAVFRSSFFNNLQMRQSSAAFRHINVVNPINVAQNAKKHLRLPDRTSSTENTKLIMISSRASLRAADLHDSTDDFELLINTRNNERIERQKNKLILNVEMFNNAKNVPTIISLLPVRRLVDSDSEESSDESLEIVDYTKEGLTSIRHHSTTFRHTKVLQDDFQRLKEARKKLRQRRHKRMLAGTGNRLNENQLVQAETTDSSEYRDLTEDTSDTFDTEDTTTMPPSQARHDFVASPLTSRLFKNIFRLIADDLSESNTALVQSQESSMQTLQDEGSDLNQELQAASTTTPSAAVHFESSASSVYFDASDTSHDSSSVSTSAHSARKMFKNIRGSRGQRTKRGMQHRNLLPKISEESLNSDPTDEKDDEESLITSKKEKQKKYGKS